MRDSATLASAPITTTIRPVPPAARPEPGAVDPVRKAAFYCALVVVFLRFSLVHEMLTKFGWNTYVLYIFSVPALLGLLRSNALSRIFSARPAYYWSAFAVWMCLAVPFSIWQGDSFRYATTYIRTDLPMLFFLAGLPMNWKECRMVLYTIALAGLVNVSTGLIFHADWGNDRAGLDFSTLANPNDFAGHLLLVIPVIIFMILRPTRIPLVGGLFRIAGIAAIGYGLYLVVASASRGALIGIVCCALVMFAKSGAKLRVGLVILIPIAVAVLVATLPEYTRTRLMSFSLESDGTTDAAESSIIRKYILEQSLLDTMSHPIFGVGPGQFGTFEGQQRKAGEKKLAAWINPHNSYTQISSENGIPGLLLYLAGIISPVVLIFKINRRSKRSLALKEYYLASFCLTLSYVGFLVAITFLNFAYFFYLPALAGLVVAIWRSFQIDSAKLASVAAPAAAITNPARPMFPIQKMVEETPPPAAGSNRFRFNRYR